ncbi:MAG: methionine adenosyltransferase [Firmicutes bacterium]|nr:methionine adenosyltransferase [Bacillota bacterium]
MDNLKTKTNRRLIKTSESVTEGHPDKMCDQIADAILDAILQNDKTARVACEVIASTGLIFVFGEITTNTYVDIKKVVRGVVADIGYTRAKYGFDASTCSVILAINEQSSEIAAGVNKSLEVRDQHTANSGKGTANSIQRSVQGQKDIISSKVTQKTHRSSLNASLDQIGAGDQGMMYGYATDESEQFSEYKGQYMPLPIMLSHKLAHRLATVRKDKTLAYLRPDGKTQVSVEYEVVKHATYTQHIPRRVDTIVISTQHEPNTCQKKLKADLIKHVVEKVIPKELLDKNTIFHINPAGEWTEGGPSTDSGLTGRKLIVDTYGGYSHGGGAFSGKDPTKVDRSGAYMARYICKNIVAAGLAKKVQVQIAYAIGKAQPVSVYVDTFGTNQITNYKLQCTKASEKTTSVSKKGSEAKRTSGIDADQILEQIISEVFDMRPQAIIQHFELQRPIYRQTATYGHFGKADLPWEVVDKVEELRKKCKV